MSDMTVSGRLSITTQRPWESPIVSSQPHLRAVPTRIMIGNLTINGSVNYPACDLDKLIDLEGDVEVVMQRSGRINRAVGIRHYGKSYSFLSVRQSLNER